MWNFRSARAVFTANTTRHQLPLNLSSWLPSGSLVEDTFFLVTLSVSTPNRLVMLEPSTMIVNIPSNIITTLPDSDNDTSTRTKQSPTQVVNVTVSTVYLPCPQPSNEVSRPNRRPGVSNNSQPIILGVILGCVAVIIVTVTIPIAICIIRNEQRKRGSYDLISRSSAV